MLANSSLFKEAARDSKIQPVDNLPSFWRSGTFSQSAASTQIVALHIHHNFLTFLAIAQKLKIDFLQITWHPAMDRVGEGGTAEIRQSLVNVQTHFAFKRFKGSLSDCSYFQALISEVTILADTSIRDHENIIRLEGICWEITTSKNEVRPVLVFEKAQYGDLEQFLRSDSRSEIDSRTRLKLCVDVGLAILSMHSNSIIHGDVKPQNVLVFRKGPNEYVARVTDFGYSTHCAGGNPVYMPWSWPWGAPEHHHRGFSFCQAVKMDIYSFGMLCLWLIFEKQLSKTIPIEVVGERRGYAVFSLRRIECQGQNLLSDLKSENLLPKLASHLIVTNSDLDDVQKENLQIFFNSSLAKHPEQRCSSIRQLLALIDPGVKIPSISPVEKLEDPLFHEDFQIVPSIRQLYYTDFRVRSHITSSLEKRIFDSLPNSCRNETCLQKAAFQLAFAYKLGFGVRRDGEKSHAILKQSLHTNSDLEEDVELVKRAWPHHRFQQENINNLNSLGYIRQFDYGQNYRQCQILDIAEREYKREIDDIQNILGNEHSIVAILKSTLASIFRNQGRWGEAEELDTKLLETVKQGSDIDYLDTITVAYTHNLAVDLLNQGKHEAAEKMNHQVLEAMKVAHGIDHPDTLSSMSNLASTFYSRGKFKAAEEMHRLALEGRVKVLGKKHRETLTSMNNLALTLQIQAKKAEAETAYRQALKICEEILGNEHPDTLAIMNNLGLTLYQQEKNEEAQEIHQRVLESRESMLGEEHPSTLSTVNNLALVLDRQGCYEAAEKLYQRAFLGFEKVLGAEHPDTLLTMTKVASVLGKQRKYQEAEEMHHLVVDRHEKALGKRHPYTIMAVSDWD